MIYPSLAGQLRDFELPQVISILEYSRMTGTLRITGPDGRGSLVFEEGAMVGAEAGTARGELAVVLLLSWTEGSFSFTRGGSTSERQPLRSNQSMVLEAARLLDESRSGQATFAPTQRPGAEELKNGTRRVFASLSGPASVIQVAASCGLTPLEAYFHLEELERLGAVSRCEGAAPAGEKRTRILVVDDSPLMQKVLARLYESDPSLVVAGTASNGSEALDKLRELKPDLVSLDLYMPVMDGVTTLKHIMLSQPTPTVVVTAANPEALDLTFESILRFGAIDFITKPSKSRGDLAGQTASILRRAKKAARANLRGLRMVQPPPPVSNDHAGRGPCHGVIVATAGTGGCLSYLQFLTSLPHDLPFAVVGFLPLTDEFLRAFVSYVGSCAPFDVELAADGAPLEGGVCYLASPETTVRLVPGVRGPLLSVVHGSEGTVSPAMADAADLFGPRAAGLVLSGEGDEALAGLAAIRAASGITLAQLPASCVDPEQPERAIAARLVDRVVLPSHISGSLSQLLMTRQRESAAVAAHEEEVVSAWPERNV